MPTWARQVWAAPAYFWNPNGGSGLADAHPPILKKKGERILPLPFLSFFLPSFPPNNKQNSGNCRPPPSPPPSPLLLAFFLFIFQLWGVVFTPPPTSAPPSFLVEGFLHRTHFSFQFLLSLGFFLLFLLCSSFSFGGIVGSVSR